MTAQTKQEQLDETVYEVTIAGLYKGQVSGAPAGQGVSKPYRVSVKIDHETITEHGPLSPFKRFLAPEMMPKQYPDYLNLETFAVISTTCNKPELVKQNIHHLNFDQLKLYVQENEIPVTLGLYQSAEELRQGIINCQKDPIGHQLTEKYIAKKYGVVYSTKAKLEKLNALNQQVNEPAEKKEEKKLDKV